MTDQPRGTTALTQNGRTLVRLGIHSIPDGSAPDNGRIEWLFGTVQDGLDNQLAGTGIATISAANAFWRPSLRGTHTDFS